MSRPVGAWATLLVITLVLAGCTPLSGPAVEWPTITIALMEAEKHSGWMFLDIQKREREKLLIVDFTVTDNVTGEIVARPADLYEPEDWEFMREMHEYSWRVRFGFAVNPTHPHTAIITLEFKGHRKQITVEYDPDALPS